MSEKLDELLGAAETHESYGTVRMTRASSGGTGQALFGSSIRHNTVIRVSVCRALLRRSLNEDRIFPEEEILVFEMSPSQFSEWVTSMDRGEGVPCTLTRFDGHSIPSPPFKSKRAQFEKEFQEKCQVLGDKMSELQTFVESLMDKTAVGKGERATLMAKVRDMRNTISSGLPFVTSQFHAQMEKSVREAKGEIEAFLQGRLDPDGVEGVGHNGLLALEGGHTVLRSEGNHEPGEVST